MAKTFSEPPLLGYALRLGDSQKFFFSCSPLEQLLSHFYWTRLPTLSKQARLSTTVTSELTPQQLDQQDYLTPFAAVTSVQRLSATMCLPQEARERTLQNSVNAYVSKIRQISTYRQQYFSILVLIPLKNCMKLVLYTHNLIDIRPTESSTF